MLTRTYNIELNMTESSKAFWFDYLSQSMNAYNECALFVCNNKVQLSLQPVHNAVYSWMREKYSLLPAQAIIKIYKDVLANVRSMKSNKHKNGNIPQRKNLAIRLDKRLYNNLSVKGIALSGEQKHKRQFVTFKMYEQAEMMFNHFIPKDPLIFMRGNRIFLSVPFEVPSKPCSDDTAIGVDLGLKRLFVTSEGKYYQDKEYLKRRRSVRYLKSKLKEKGTKSAKRHLKKLKNKERNISKGMCEHAVNTLLKSTKTSILVLEDLTKIKQNTSKTEEGFLRKKHNSRMSQVPFYKFKEILTYKAQLVGKQVETVSPAYTSQIDSRTGKKDGLRCGCRYICTDNVVLDADWNAAVNICKKSKHPMTSYTPIDGGMQPLVGRCPSTRQTWCNREVATASV